MNVPPNRFSEVIKLRNTYEKMRVRLLVSTGFSLATFVEGPLLHWPVAALLAGWYLWRTRRAGLALAGLLESLATRPPGAGRAS